MLHPLPPVYNSRRMIEILANLKIYSVLNATNSVARPTPTFIVGDINTNPLVDPYMRIFLDHGFVSAHQIRWGDQANQFFSYVGRVPQNGSSREREFHTYFIDHTLVNGPVIENKMLIEASIIVPKIKEKMTGFPGEVPIHSSLLQSHQFRQALLRWTETISDHLPQKLKFRLSRSQALPP